MDKETYELYDNVVLTQSKSCDMYTFCAGQSVKIVGIGTNGYDIADGLGRVIAGCGWQL